MENQKHVFTESEIEIIAFKETDVIQTSFEDPTELDDVTD